jgi:hypothetical protein
MGISMSAYRALGPNSVTSLHSTKESRFRKRRKRNSIDEVIARLHVYEAFVASLLGKSKRLIGRLESLEASLERMFFQGPDR